MRPVLVMVFSSFTWSSGDMMLQGKLVREFSFKNFSSDIPARGKDTCACTVIGPNPVSL